MAAHGINPSNEDGFSFLSRNETFDPGQGAFLALLPPSHTVFPFPKQA